MDRWKGARKMFKKLFSKKETEEALMAPLSGKVVALSEVPDPTFSEKMLGDGIAIMPTEGRVVSPVNGEIITVFPTKHAIGIRSEQEAEILIHIGLETVQMNGEGFKQHIQEGDKVKAGQLLMEFSLDLVREKAKSTITPVIITNLDQKLSVQPVLSPNAKSGETTIMKVKF
jgi:sugar PTS system EIIA component